MRVQAVLAVSICSALLAWLYLSRIEHEQDARPAAAASIGANEEGWDAGTVTGERETNASQRLIVPAVAEGLLADDGETLASSFSRTLRIEVVDPSGRPAAQVALAAFEARLSDWDAAFFASTDQQGVATLTIVRDEPFDSARPWRVATPLVACEPEFLELSLAGPLPEALRVRIAESAAIEVRTRAAGGDRLDLPAVIALSVVANPDHPFGIANFSSLSVDARAGRARFERIGVGLELEIDARSDYADFAVRTVAAPRQPDATLAVALQTEAVFPLVRARLIAPRESSLDERGIQARAAATFRDGSSDEWRFSGRVHASSVGRVEFHVDSQYIARLGPWIEYTARRPGHPRWTGRVSIGAPTREHGLLERDVYEVGDVTLNEAPYFVCGQVVDADGNGVELSFVTLSEVDTNGVERTCAQVRADDEGAFEIDTTCDADEHRIRAAREDHEPGPAQIVRRRASGLKLRLGAEREHGAVRGSLLLPTGANCDSLRLQFNPLNADGSLLGSYEISSACEFESNQVAPGDYALVVRFEREVLLRSAAFTVVAGATTVLDPIDLRNRVHALAVTVTNSDEDALPDAWVQVLEPDGSGGQHAESDAKGLAILTTLQPRHDLVVMAAGYRTQFVRDTASGARIALADGVSARLRPPDLGADANGFLLLLQLERETAEEDLPVNSLELTLAGALPLDVRFSAPGRYRVTNASWRELATGVETPIEWPPELLLDVPEQGGELVFEWPLDTLREALPRARPK
jgi:hypothetical protein